MYIVKRDIFVLIKIIASCVTSGIAVFFISSLSGQDLIKNNETIGKLEILSSDISTELDTEIDKRVKQLGEVPEMEPYRKFYCVELAKEIHEISYMAEKHKILFDTYNVRDFENKMKLLLKYTEVSAVDSLLDELEIVKRELKNTVNVINKKRDSLVRQRMSYIALFVLLWIILYLYYSRGIVFQSREE